MSLSPAVHTLCYKKGVKRNVTNEGRMAYIDSELAKRQAAEGLAPVSASARGGGGGTVGWKDESGLRKDIDVQRQPAALGKLMEIDLGDEARDRNVQRTDKARRRLGGEEVEEEVVLKPVKIRLGPDGKPWRGRKRRGSDDVKRDKLVEEVMRENRRMCPLLFFPSNCHDTNI